MGDVISIKPKSGERTLVASVVLSAPGPIVVGIGLILGRSSTQLADFIRRSAELAAIIVSWAVYRRLHKSEAADIAHKQKLERTANTCVGAAMCLSGAAMAGLALLPAYSQKGNVILGLIIAVLGVITNTWFYFRYRKLDREKPNAILAVQSKLYSAKSVVDACVTAALLTVALSPGSAAARYMDMGGSLIVAAYLIINGIAAVRGGRGVYAAKPHIGEGMVQMPADTGDAEEQD